MIIISRALNFLTGGSPSETVCARLKRADDNGSVIAPVAIFLIDGAFYLTIGQINHVKGL